MVLTILSGREENLSSFGTLLDGDLPEVAELQEAEAEGEAMEGQQKGFFEEGEIRARHPRVSNHCTDSQASRTRRCIVCWRNEIDGTVGIKDFKGGAKYLKLSASGSKSKIFNRIKDCYEQSLKRKNIGSGEAGLCQIVPRTQVCGCTMSNLQSVNASYMR